MEDDHPSSLWIIVIAAGGFYLLLPRSFFPCLFDSAGVPASCSFGPHYILYVAYGITTALYFIFYFAFAPQHDGGAWQLIVLFAVITLVFLLIPRIM